jgi:hypothetical protein
MLRFFSLILLSLCLVSPARAEETTSDAPNAKQQWQALEKEEKLRLIEERRKARLQKMEERWSQMSDDEKIRHVEERMQRKGSDESHTTPTSMGLQ